MTVELNMDGLVGPTHHYAGLANGNLASMSHAHTPANPKAAALQGIAKMRLIYEAGIPQAFLPPHPRPHFSVLRQLGFTGRPEQLVEKAYKYSPQLLSAAYSSSHMWAANAATVGCHLDCKDGKTHFTTANLNANLHRHIESRFTHHLLKIAFASSDRFQHHEPLPSTCVMGDEGAANHTRLCQNHQSPGINLFVFGQQSLNNVQYKRPHRYWARQTLEASCQIAHNHGHHIDMSVFACQNPEVIDLGVFHNDVISVGNENLLLVHESAYVDQKAILDEIQHKASFDIHISEVTEMELPLSEAVKTYLFNSQLITLPKNQGMLLVAPTECEQSDKSMELINRWITDTKHPLTQVIYLNLKQSMQNGGGPACLRLRIPLPETDLRLVHPSFMINNEMLVKLESWVNRYYRDTLHIQDLQDPQLIKEVQSALEALSHLMKIPNLYPYQTV